MRIRSLEGSIPGSVQAVVEHGGRTEVLAMELACQDGAWVARSDHGSWSPRSSTPPEAALLAAADSQSLDVNP